MSILTIVSLVVTGASVISAAIPKDTNNKFLKGTKAVADILAVNVAGASNKL